MDDSTTHTGRDNAVRGRRTHHLQAAGITTGAPVLSRPVLFVALHIDLVWTDLDDFVEHFTREICDRNTELLDASYRDYWLLWGWGGVPSDPDDPFDDPARARNYELTDSSSFVQVTSTVLGSTQVAYWVMHGSAQDDEKTITGMDFSLSAKRFRRDRLRITLWSAGNTYGPRFRNWLIKNWGKDGIIERKLVDAPDAPPRPAPPLVIETVDALRDAVYAIPSGVAKSEWWAEVAKLYDAHKRTKPKYTYGRLAELLGMEEKNVGRMVRKYRPKTP